MAETHECRYCYKVATSFSIAGGEIDAVCNDHTGIRWIPNYKTYEEAELALLEEILYE